MNFQNSKFSLKESMKLKITELCNNSNLNSIKVTNRDIQFMRLGFIGGAESIFEAIEKSLKPLGKEQNKEIEQLYKWMHNE